MVTSTYRMPDGAQAEWDVMTAADAVAVVALTDDERVDLVEFRPGPARLLDELPGGELNDGETPLHAALRELAEETGYTGDVTVLASTWQGANIARRQWAACATNCRKIGQPSLDPSEEFCETITVSLHGLPAPAAIRAADGRLGHVRRSRPPRIAGRSSPLTRMP